MDTKKMERITETELRKLYNYKYSLYGFAYPKEIEGVRKRLRLGGIRFKTLKIYEQGKLIGYKVYVR